MIYDFDERQKALIRAAAEYLRANGVPGPYFINPGLNEIAAGTFSGIPVEHIIGAD